MTPKWTKGPWIQCKADGDGCCCHLVWSKPRDCIVSVALSARDEHYTLGEGVQDETTLRANARLIASAPSLFEALQGTVAMLDLVCGNVHPEANEVLAKARAALDLALGTK